MQDYGLDTSYGSSIPGPADHETLAAKFGVRVQERGLTPGTRKGLVIHGLQAP